MKEIEFTASIKTIDSMESLSMDDQELIKEAIEQLDIAYAPYSDFNVGASVRLSNGASFQGSNQENASYPLCICGERVALYHAAVLHPDIPMKTLAIVARNNKKTLPHPVFPCGACRQVIVEYETRHNQKMKILLKGDSDEIYILESGHSLLPFSFDGSFL